MSLDTSPFVHDFQPGTIHFGRGSVANLAEALAAHDCDRALVVCGQNVAANEALMDPVRAALGDRLAGVFADTSPDKRVETAYDAVERVREDDVDALVPVGAGSSLDVATVVTVLHSTGRPVADVEAEVAETGALPALDPTGLLPVVPVPTTFAGADLSVAAGISVPDPDGGRQSTGVVDDRVMPAALVYDPALFETAPADVLAGSAFNGMDKAVEALYSAPHNPVTDATAVRALRYLRGSLPELRAKDPDAMEQAVMGVVLAQYGVSTPGAYKLSLIHAFGHALRDEFDLQQGIAHAVVAPAALRYLFDEVDGRRELLAEGLLGEVPPDPDPAEAVVDALTEIRAALDLPTRLRDLPGISEDGLRAAAEATLADDFTAAVPAGLDPTVDELTGVLRDAW